MAEAMIQVSGDDDSAWAQLWEKTQWTTHPVLFKKKCTIYYLKKQNVTKYKFNYHIYKYLFLPVM